MKILPNVIIIQTMKDRFPELTDTTYIFIGIV